MAQLNDALQSNLAVVVAALAVVSLILLTVIVVQAMRLRRVGHRLDDLTRGSDGRSLEGVLAGHLDTVFRVSGELETVRSRVSDVEALLPLAFQRVGLVRFNPFQDTGGNQSFALAMLNGENNGYVVSSLHSRAGTRVYAKAIKAGKCETALSSEEEQAVDLAQSGPNAQATAGRSVPARSSAAAVAAGQTAAAQTAAPTSGNGPAMARRVGGPIATPSDPPIDGAFLERRLRGEDDGQSAGLWEDPSRS